MLLLNAGNDVTFGSLAEAVWPEGEPPRSVNALQAQITRLRRYLAERLDGRQLIETRGFGYRIVLRPGDLDLERFEHLRRAARQRAGSDPGGALDLLRTALALWQGPALADIRDHSATLHAAAVQAEENRMLAIEELIDLNFRLGRHGRIIGDLKRLAAEYPMRERLYGRLIIALGKTGRRAEAAQYFRRTHEQMVDELGISPSSELNQVLADILADPQG
ncbi:AfsR/SARP family transcriptional regulator [Haloechinothrix sp. LS1_15]|nr:AfsR/SARP family transcriptional regulator [Haloechinothrix sp. LS1_15]